MTKLKAITSLVAATKSRSDESPAPPPKRVNAADPTPEQRLHTDCVEQDVLDVLPKERVTIDQAYRVRLRSEEIEGLTAGNMTAFWCILQTSGGRTLAVVRSLRAAGFNVWAPTGMVRRKRPRSDKYRDEPTALLTGVVFARHEDAARLSAAARSPISQHPSFSLLMHQGTYGRVTDASLEPLREFETSRATEWSDFVAAEERARLERIRKKKGRKRARGRLNAARSYVLGQTVQVEGSAFQGLTAKVVENKRNGSLVIELGGLLGQIEVETCDVKPVHVEHAQPEQAPVT